MSTQSSRFSRRSFVENSALAVGLLDELVAPEQLLATALTRANALLALPPVAMNTTRLATKARLIEALSSSGDAAAATGWWFSVLRTRS